MPIYWDAVTAAERCHLDGEDNNDNYVQSIDSAFDFAGAVQAMAFIICMTMLVTSDDDDLDYDKLSC